MKHRSRRLGAIVAVIAVVAAMFAGVAAYAATQLSAGTAKLITSPDVYAGSSGPVTVEVSNPSTLLGVGGATVNLVVIHPANGFTIQAPPSPAPSGWHYQLRGGDAIFTGGTIAAGSTADFTVPTVADRPAGNVTSNWQAQSSADDGKTLALDSTDSTGTMTSTVHVLKVTAAALGAPTGATDNTVTAGQNNTSVNVTVQNGSPAALTVTPKLTAGGGGDSVGTLPADQSIAGNDGTATFTVPVSFGSASGTTPRHFTADATAPGASAAIAAVTQNITVQAASAFAFVANSLSPTTVPAGARTFNLSMNKTGDPALTLTGATSALTFKNGANSFDVPLNGDKAVGAGAVTSILSFAGTVPVVPDGVYTGTAHLVGTDANGAVVDTTVSVASITIDNTGPGVLATLSSPTLDKDGKPVAKDGTTLTIGGSVFNSGTSGPLDQTATITSCTLKILGGPSAVNSDVTPSCTINKGALGGTVTLNSGGLPSGTVSLTVNVQDLAGNTGSGSSGAIAIDNVLPSFAAATTKDVNTIVVTTSEPVEGTFQAPDWAVNGSAAKSVTFDGSNSAFGTTLTITTQNAFGPNDTPTVTYSRLEPAALGTVHDAAGNNAATSASLTAVDKIAPVVPVLSLVNTKPKFQDDGLWYTNSVRPTFTVVGGAGDEIIIHQEGNGTSALDSSTDPLVCTTSVPAGQTTASCSGPAWTSDGPQRLYIYAWDPHGNRSVDASGGYYSTSTVVLDRVSPALTTAVVNKPAATVTVTMNERLGSGRDFAVDWQVGGSAAGQAVNYAIQSVSATSATTRVLHIDPNDPNWTSGSVTTAAYTFTGSVPTDRYADRAGNFLPDGSVAAG